MTKWNRSYDNIWSVLSLFFSSNEIGLCKSQIDSQLKLGINTGGICIKRLLNNNLINLVARNVGPNKCKKYYKITELGKNVFLEYINKQQQHNLKKYIHPKLEDF